MILAEKWHYNFFGLEFDFDPVAFSIGDFSVMWYGIFIAIGFLLALAYGYKNAKRYEINQDRMFDVIIAGLIGAIICARAFSLIGDNVPLSRFDTFGAKMEYIFGIHNGGISILGGILGAFSFGGVTAWLRKVNVLDMFDLASTGFLIGQVVGRIGNFINQEVYGLPTGSDWFGIGGSEIGAELVHPLFLYEMLMNTVIFIALHYMSKRRFFKGQIFISYIAAYSFGRFWLEGRRDVDFVLMIGKISLSQLTCIILFTASIVLLVVLYNRSKASGKDDSYSGVFGEMCDDETVLAAAYELLGCTDENTDDEVESAYNSLRGKYEALITEEAGNESADGSEILSKSEQRKRDRLQRKAEKERAEHEQGVLEADAPEVDDEGNVEISEEELAIRAKARLAELEKAYKYICGNRELAALERSEFEQIENTDSDEIEKEVETDDAD